MDLKELRVRITADIDKYKDSLKKAGEQAKEFGEKVKKESGKGGTALEKLGKSLLELKEPFTKAAKLAAGALTAFAAFSVVTIALTDKQIKLARQMGLTNEEFHTLARAADLSGLSISEMERNMKMINIKLVEARDAGGPAAEAFRKIGLSIDEMMSMKPEDQLIALSDALKGVEGYSDRAAIANKLFGISGQKMLILLEDTKGAFGRANQEANNFGLVLDGVDSRNIEAAQDDISSLTLAMKGLGTQFAATVAPAMSKVTNQLAKWIGGYALAIKKAREYQRIVEGKREEVLLEEEIIELSQKYASLLVERKKHQEQVTKWGAEGSKLRIEEINKEIEAITTAIAKDKERKEELANQPPEADPLAGFGTAPTPAGAPAGAEELAADNVFYAARLKALQDSLLSEEELLMQQQEERRELVQLAYENEEIDNATHNELMLQIDQDYMDRLAEIRKNGLTAIGRFNAMAWHQQTTQVVGELASLTQGLDSTNKKQFKIMKAGAIATAIINTYKGISQSLGNYPWPLAGIMAAAHAAAGWAQVSNIRKQEFTSAGSGGGYAAPASPVAATATQESGGSSSGSMVTINLQGQTYQKQDVVALINEINEAVGDGSKIRIA